jgi:hypothetical protein
MRLYVFGERVSNLSMIRQIKQVPKPLRPRNWAQQSNFVQLGNILAAGGVQGVAIIAAPRADASCALANSVAQLEPPVVELGAGFVQ